MSVSARVELCDGEVTVTLKWPMDPNGLAADDRSWLDRIKDVMREIEDTRTPKCEACGR